MEVKVKSMRKNKDTERGIYRVYIPIYKGYFYIFYGVSHADLCKYLQVDESVIPVMDAYTTGNCSIHVNNNVTIRLRDKVGLWVLMHELFHGVVMFLRDKGMIVSDDSDEGYAYLFEYIVKELSKQGLIDKLIKNK